MPGDDAGTDEGPVDGASDDPRDEDATDPQRADDSGADGVTIRDAEADDSDETDSSDGDREDSEPTEREGEPTEREGGNSETATSDAVENETDTDGVQVEDEAGADAIEPGAESGGQRVSFEDAEPAVERVPGTDRDPIFGEETTGAVERVVPPEGWAVGDYTWVDYLEEYREEDAAEQVRQQRLADRADAAREPVAEGEEPPPQEPWPPYPGFDEVDAEPSAPDWDEVDYDPTDELGFKPEAKDVVVDEAASRATRLHEFFDEYTDPETTPVVKDEWMWEHFKREYYYVGENNWTRPRDEDGEIVRFDPVEYLGFDPENTEQWLSVKETAGQEMLDLEDERTVNVREDVDEDAFFSTVDGETTLANRYDLEKAVSMDKKRHFREVERYWVNKPYAFVVIFHSDRENEKKYYLVEPYRNPIEEDLQEFLTDKLRTAIKYASDDVAAAGDEASRRGVIERETRKLLDRYDLYDGPVASQQSLLDRLLVMLDQKEPPEAVDTDGHIDGIQARPEPAVLAEDPETLTQYQVETLLYVLQRNFI
ncbi:MAG: secretion system protein E, partial [Halobacterium sp.]